MVEHCGGVKTDGDFVHTRTVTDIASGRTECVAMRVPEEMVIVEAFDKVASELPFAMLGVPTRTATAPSWASASSTTAKGTAFSRCARGLGRRTTRHKWRRRTVPSSVGRSATVA